MMPREITDKNEFEFCMAWENGDLTQQEEIDYFQYLVTSGKIRGLQGMYGRHANALFEAGLITGPHGEKYVKQPFSRMKAYRSYNHKHLLFVDQEKGEKHRHYKGYCQFLFDGGKGNVTSPRSVYRWRVVIEMPLPDDVKALIGQNSLEGLQEIDPYEAVTNLMYDASRISTAQEIAGDYQDYLKHFKGDKPKTLRKFIRDYLEDVEEFLNE